MEEKKHIISRILIEKRQWFDTEIALPNEGQEVVIRLFNKDMTSGEVTPDGSVFAVEDEKIGFYINGKWMISSPYPKFDYSPLSNGPTLNEGTVVTHWAVPEEATDKDVGELEAWKNRFKIAGKYDEFVVRIDKKHEELLYRACSWGAASIRQLIGENEDSLPIIALLWDIQNLMDQNAEIRNGELIKE